jgi:uncharacterized membrane protein
VSGEEHPEQSLPLLERGRDLSRIVAFTDGVFAIAITLLVLQIEVPDDVTSASHFLERLADLSPDFTAFWISFIVIGAFWISNHRFMRTVREFDRGLMVLLLPYLGFMVLIPFTSQLMGEYSDRFDIAVILYVVNMAAMAFAGFLMMNHVLRRGLGMPEYEWDIRLSRKSALFTAAAFTATIPFVFLLGPWTPILWIGLRWDPYQRRRDGAYAPSAPDSVDGVPGSKAAPADAADGADSLADGDGSQAVDDTPPRE